MTLGNIIEWLGNSVANFDPSNFALFDFTGGFLSNPLTIVLWLAVALIALRWVL